jgi:hypothetical protein
MNIDLHIERLVLDGLNVGAGQGAQVKAAVEAELTRLLASGGVSEELQSGGALYKLRTAGIEVANDKSPARLGEQIAGAVYGGIGK